MYLYTVHRNKSHKAPTRRSELNTQHQTLYVSARWATQKIVLISGYAVTLIFDLLTSKPNQFIFVPRCITDKSLLKIHQCTLQVLWKQYPGRTHTHRRTHGRHENTMPVVPPAGSGQRHKNSPFCHSQQLQHPSTDFHKCNWLHEQFTTLGRTFTTCFKINCLTMLCTECHNWLSISLL